MRSTPTGLGCGLTAGVIAVFAFASSAAARFDYAAPCVSEEDFVAMVQPLLPPGRDVRAAADGFSIRIVSDRSGFLLDVRAGSEDDFVRQVRDGSCLELARAAAQIVALTVEDTPPPTAAAGARLLSSGALQPRAAAIARSFVIGVELSLLGAAGLVPGVGVGTGAHAFVDVEQWSVTLGFRYWYSQTQDLPAEQLRVSIYEAVLGVTWRAIARPGWSLGPQLALSLGPWVAHANTNSVSTWLARSTLGASFVIDFSRRVQLELLACGALPWSRPGYVDSGGTRGFRPAPVGFEGGISVRFAGYP